MLKDKMSKKQIQSLENYFVNKKHIQMCDELASVVKTDVVNMKTDMLLTHQELSLCSVTKKD